MLVDEQGDPLIADDSVVPELSERQKQEAEDRTNVSAVVVHEAIRHDGEEELQRPISALAWSGLAAGLSMGFSFVGEGLLRSRLPDAPWRPLIVGLGYSLGFLIVIGGRQQLFTENTLTAIIPLLARRSRAALFSVMRLWTVVLLANLAGAHLFAWTVGNTSVFSPEVLDSLRQLAEKAAQVTFGAAILRGIFAGWLIAMMVWMLAAIETGRFAVIVVMTYAVGVSDLTHIVAGSVEILFLVMTGKLSWWAYAGGYMIPTLMGNIIGGVALVSAVNHAQVVSGREPNRKKQERRRL